MALNERGIVGVRSDGTVMSWDDVIAESFGTASLLITSFRILRVSATAAVLRVEARGIPADIRWVRDVTLPWSADERYEGDVLVSSYSRHVDELEMPLIEYRMATLELAGSPPTDSFEQRPTSGGWSARPRAPR